MNDEELLENPEYVIQEALREYIGDGDGIDSQVLEAYDEQFIVRIKRLSHSVTKLAGKLGIDISDLIMEGYIEETDL